MATIKASVGGYGELDYELWKKIYPKNKLGFFQRDNNTESSWKYANTVNQQINPNLKKDVKWTSGGNAVGNSSKYASSQYTKKGSTYKYPYKVTAHDFGFNIPVNARIEFVVVQVCMKSSKSGASTFPSAGFYITDKHKDIDSKLPTGFHNGVWWDTSDRKIGKSDTIETYFINGANFRKAGNKPEHLNGKYFGVDLNFAEKCEEHTVYLKWVRCKVYYTMPRYSLVHDKQSKGMSATATNPDVLKTGNTNTLIFTLKQTTKAYGGHQCFDLVVPYGISLVGEPIASTGTSFENNQWRVNCNGETKATLTVKFIDYTVDTQAITLKSTTDENDCGYEPYAPSKSYYFTSNYGTVDDYGDTVTSLMTASPHYRHPCCFLLSSKIESTNDSTFQFDLAHDFDFENMSCEIVGSTDSDISIVSYNNNRIVLSLIDAIFYDEAVTGHKNENTYHNANCEETVEDNGTVVAYKGSGAYLQYKFGQTTSTAKPFSIGAIIEFDIVDCNGMAIIIYGSSNYTRALPTTNCHMKIIIDTDYITVYQDDTQIAQVQTSTYITDNFSFGLTTNSAGKYIKYKNFVVYPIYDIEDTVANVDIQICLRPLETGLKHFEGRTHNGGGKHNQVKFTIAEPYEYHFANKALPNTTERFNSVLEKERVGFITHRIASELETGAFILPCRVKEHDSLMKQSNPSIRMYQWEQLDYIGCVPLEHLHFDPKSTYKDKLLDSHYKNKRYMGKELVSDEDITLNVRLHPHQVTTIQGLIDMDKPIPINANHRCFEGDSLNHRGWAEIYGVTTTLTNPNWYKCDIDVKYLTHNLNTRFKINKGDKSFDKYTMPTLLLETVESGDSLSSGTEEHDYFIVDTDGGYIYNDEEIQSTWYRNDDGELVIFIVEGSEFDVERIEQEYPDEEIEFVVGETEVEFEDFLQRILDDGYTLINAQIGVPVEVDDTIYTNENQRNVFTLDEGQYFNIKSKQPLSQICQISYGWSSTLISEEKENLVSKIVRLVDKDSNNAMFEYEYSDFDFSEYDDGDGQIKCHIIGRTYKKGDYDESINEDIYIPVSVIDGDDSDEDYIPMYGSELTFKLNNNVLTVEDTGYTGKAVSFSTELEGQSYFYEIEWRNKNTDGEDSDITTYVDLTVQDSILASQYASQYGNMIVSPFPVSDKRLIFTRQGEEGIIYYYENDKEEFSYLIEPYYQYHNGVDLRTADQISIFNLNYGYRTVYLENGLVSLGINRLNGQMYLRKWDKEAKEYITLFYLQLENYDDVNINNISDDRIELQASNTTISMYRGHPYVILKHELENIKILSQFGSVWAEEVGANRDTYPRYYDLLNTANLLPSCVGGKNTIDNDCLKVYECGDTVDCETDEDLCKTHSSEIQNHTFMCPNLNEVEINLKLEEQIYDGEDTTLNIATEDLVNGDKVFFIINGDVLDQEQYVMTYPTAVTYQFEKSQEYEISAVFVGDDNRSYAIAPIQTIMVEQRKIEESGGGGGTEDCPQPRTGKYHLSIETPKKFTYRDGQKVRFRLTRGGNPVCNKVIEIVDFKYMNTATTDRNGYAEFKNTHINTPPAKYKIGARFYEGAVSDPIITSDFVEVTVSKGEADWQVNQYAGTVGNYVIFKLFHKGNVGMPITNQKVTVYIDGKAYTKKTSENGNVRFKINNKGNHKYKCTFGGNKYYKAVKKSFSEKVKKSNG